MSWNINEINLYIFFIHTENVQEKRYDLFSYWTVDINVTWDKALNESGFTNTKIPSASVLALLSISSPYFLSDIRT